ncbi:Alcohol dehydrogenase superfamily, zinc-type [Metarhizium guizhouense ARSEF 977]|uniref:Alcohol dehydrogenase superfamily, zinc-type n=1 Tax=Metarhizium guizhouense (strain ARSEF 977) TaxID=1276136 RepID=A0A0B4HNW9_METGA|nr:Alcohol dehydrogenase superfamily, zinc-type [Metarhizium guizhouense ARSEF 977]
MAPTNTAAWLPAARAHPMKVDAAEYPVVGDSEVVVKVSAIALNPMDWLIQALGERLFSWLQYPYVGGTDVAGIVVELGGQVTKYKVGDRVLGLATGFTPREGAFQTYTVLRSNVSTHIPDSLSFRDAAVLPLGLCTAASGLYRKDFLALQYPTAKPVPTGKTLLVWAGASSVGTNAIQLAVASGYENWDYCMAAGASRVFDYRSDTVVQDLIAAFKGRTCAGGLAIQRGSEQPTFDVVANSEGSKFVAVAGPVPDQVPREIQAKMIFGSSLKDNEVGSKVFDDFLAGALADGKYQCLPKPMLVGHGLETLQDAMDRGLAGTSAEKLVVEI